MAYWAVLRFSPWGQKESSFKAGPLLWRTVNRQADSFQVEMPAEARLGQAMAQNEAGSTEPVHLLLASPDERTTFAVAWADRPPVVRAGDDSPGLVLQLARDQALARTQTIALSEAPTTYRGFPARELVAQNAGGGVMQTRLILTGERLYMLMVAYPSMQARREEDVNRFFDSFKLRK